MNLRYKLVLSLAIYAISMMILLWHENNTLKEFDKLKNYKEKIKELHVDMLTLRRNEKDFLLRDDLSYVQKFKTNSYKINIDIRNTIEDLKDEIDTSKLKEFDLIIREYRDKFLALVEQKKIIGLDAKSGLRASLKYSIDTILPFLQKDTKVLNKIYQLRLIEKEFFLTKDLELLKEFTKQHQIIYKKLPNKLKKQFFEYKKFFTQIVEAYETVGINKDLYLKGEMRATVHKTEDVLIDLTEDIVVVIEEKLDDIMIERVFITIITLLIMFILISVIMNKISRSVSQFKEGLEGFFDYLNNKKDKAELLDIECDDEIGQMAKTVNKNIIYTYKRIETQKQKFNKELAQKTKELSELNNKLELRVKDEVEKNLIKEIQLFSQSKQASLGSMFGNIAHQWRQPLNHISLLASSVNIRANMEGFDKEKLRENMDTIIDRVSYLAETIDTFKNFVKEKKNKQKVEIYTPIDNALDIVCFVFKDEGIHLIKKMNYDCSIKVNIVPSELSEVIINIINNAKDVLLEKEIDEPWIKVKVDVQNDKAIISIEDNGGGVPKDALPNIFKQYYTTKEEDKGTGLGLYMSKQIIDSLNGNLSVKNTKNGAKFSIELPTIN